MKGSQGNLKKKKKKKGRADKVIYKGRFAPKKTYGRLLLFFTLNYFYTSCWMKKKLLHISHPTTSSPPISPLPLPLLFLPLPLSLPLLSLSSPSLFLLPSPSPPLIHGGG